MYELISSLKHCCFSLIKERDNDLSFVHEEKVNLNLIADRKNSIMKYQDEMSKASEGPFPSTFYKSEVLNVEYKNKKNLFIAIPTQKANIDSYCNSLTYPLEKPINFCNDPFELSSSSNIMFQKLSIASSSLCLSYFITIKSNCDVETKPLIRINDHGKGLFTLFDDEISKKEIVLILKQSTESVWFHNPVANFKRCHKNEGIDLILDDGQSKKQDNEAESLLFSIEYNSFLNKYVFKPYINSEGIDERGTTNNQEHLIYMKLNHNSFQLRKDTSNYILIGTFLILLNQKLTSESSSANTAKSGPNDVPGDQKIGYWLLNIKMYDLATSELAKSAEGKSFKLDEDDIITIGRSSKNTIVCISNEISKVHLTIYFERSHNTWSIIDGTPSKKSVNGTWVVIKESIIEEGINSFRLGKSIFDIHGEYA